MLLRICT